MDETIVLQSNCRIQIEFESKSINMVVDDKRYILKGEKTRYIETIIKNTNYPCQLSVLRRRVLQQICNGDIGELNEVIRRLVNIQALLVVRFTELHKSNIFRKKPQEQINVAVIDTLSNDSIFDLLQLYQSTGIKFYVHFHATDEFLSCIQADLSKCATNTFFFHTGNDVSYVKDALQNIDFVVLIQRETETEITRAVRDLSIINDIPFLNSTIAEKDMVVGPLYINSDTACVKCAMMSNPRGTMESIRIYAPNNEESEDVLFGYYITFGEMKNYIFPSRKHTPKTRNAILYYSHQSSNMRRLGICKFPGCVCGKLKRQEK